MDPATVQRLSADDGWDEYDIEQHYEDDVREAWRTVVDDRAWYVRHLVAHAAELVGAIVDTALTGDAKATGPLLAQRDELVLRLASAVTAWELAVVGKMDVDGDSEHVALVRRWLNADH